MNEQSYPLRHPCAFAAVMLAAVLLVGAATAVAVRAANLTMLVHWTSSSAVLALVGALLLTRLGWWRRVGFRRSERPVRHFLLWIPLCPILLWNIAGIEVSGIVSLDLMLLWLGLTMTAAFAEEVIFRGLMLRALEPRGLWRAAVLTSLLFGAMHGFNGLAETDPVRMTVQVVLAAAIGFAYAAYALHTGMIWPLIIVHALADFAGLIDRESIARAEAIGHSDLIRWLVSAAVFAVYGAWVLRRTVRPPVVRIGFSLFFVVVSGLSLALSPSVQAQEKNGSATGTIEEITLNGVKQWILVREKNAGNPVLLFLHGGPGFPEMPYSHVYTSSLVERFIVVDWDQRGAGKSFDPAIPKETMNLEQFLSDTHALIQLLKSRYSKDRIYLVGHSWGSVLGLYTAHRHPEDLYAYIGMGQVVDMKKSEKISYDFTVRKAGEAGDETATALLEKIGPPPYKGGFPALSTQRMLLARYGGSVRGLSLSDFEKIRNASPFYTRADNDNYMNAFMISFSLMWDDLQDVDFLEEVPEVKIPVFFFTGRHDYQTPFELTEQYVKALKAPHKEIVWFEKSAHMPSLEEPEAYQERMISVVLERPTAK